MIINRKSFNKYLKSVVILLLTILVYSSCSEQKSNDAETKAYLAELVQERKEKDYNMQFDGASPFLRDTSVTFKPLKYFEPNPDFIFKSKLHKYETQDTVTIFGTKGESRAAILIGFLEFEYDGNKNKINVYKSFSRTGEEYYSIWFTDKTTGKTTYGVGRYLDFELNDDPDFVYTLDFNKAYNPYCAYSPLFTCPIPRQEDYIDIEIEAGEKNFH